jgi:hypothetical protein
MIMHISSFVVGPCRIVWSSSPKCKDEVSRWNKRTTHPLVRAWEGADLETEVSKEAVVLAKYRLAAKKEPHASQSLLPVALLGSKAIQAAYGRASMTGAASPELEFAAALVDLVAVRLAQMEAGRRSAAILTTWC